MLCQVCIRFFNEKLNVGTWNIDWKFKRTIINILQYANAVPATSGVGNSIFHCVQNSILNVVPTEILEFLHDSLMVLASVAIDQAGNVFQYTDLWFLCSDVIQRVKEHFPPFPSSSNPFPKPARLKGGQGNPAP